MTQKLHRLVYYSRNRVSGPAEVRDAEIRSILAASRRNNAPLGVTGALMFNAGVFAQVLEGPCSEVERLFERIQQDERHGDVSLLALEEASGRAFGSWSMAFVGASTEASSRYSSISEETSFDLATMTGDSLFATLHRLALEEESALT